MKENFSICTSKIKNVQQKLRGSILAYSLIILAMMFAIAGSMSTVSILEKKGAGSSQASAQAFQVADSGVQLAIKKINNVFGLNSDNKIKNAFPTCNNGAVSLQLDSNQPYTLTFYDDSDALITDCDEYAKNVASIKSVGSYKTATRAIKVAVAATPAFTFPENCGWKNLGGLLANLPGNPSTCGICDDSEAGKGLVLGYGFSVQGGGANNFNTTPKIYCCFYSIPASSGGDKTISTPCP